MSGFCILYTQRMPSLFETDAPRPIAGYAQVAVERAVDLDPNGLTYAIPVELDDLKIGQRVIVPLGRGSKPVAGYVVKRIDEPSFDPKKIKPILKRESKALSLTPALIQLGQWIASFYVSPLGMTLATMLPAAVKHGTGTKSKTFVQPASKAPTANSDKKLPKLQQTILETAHRLKDENQEWIEIKRLADEAGAKTTGPVRQLIDKALLVSRRHDVVDSDLDLRAARVAEPPKKIELSDDQQSVICALSESLGKGFSAHLLHGVTGSGKTEVYLRLIERLRRRNSQDTKDCVAEKSPGVIIMVPEIALTPQTVARFLGRFDDVAVLHSGLTAAQRHAQWRRVRSGEMRILIGARSAVFAPVKNLQLIIVDEEHESSYKQDQVPRYHGRDVAIKRAQLAGIPIVLGSATPSFESWQNANEPVSKSWHYLSMPRRVPGLNLPTVQLVDLGEERRKRYEMTGDRGFHLLSMAMENHIRRTLKEQRQVLLLLNRRGYASYIACPDASCGWSMQCQHCDVAMVYHKGKTLPRGGVVRCHHCGTEQLLPERCPVEGCGKKLMLFGIGTQRVEEEIQRKFEGIRFARMDSDTMRTAAHYRETLDRFREGELDLLLGTQMIAKGLDFPGVGLVGVVNADTSMNQPDFRAGERTFQLVAQVAGRCGRGQKAGLVIVQSMHILDPVIQLAAQHDYVTFAEKEIQLRRENFQPPVARMARIVLRDRDFEKARQRANDMASLLGQANQQTGLKIRMLGPTPCSIARIADHYRFEILLFADPPQPAVKLQQLLATLRHDRRLISDTTTAIDIDPVSLM